MKRVSARVALSVAIVLTAMSSRAMAAQITTGTVAGTTIDAQGGVIPGATVTLTSETRGTESTPVVTNATGDFVFPNVPTDTYTIKVTMPSFKTIKRSGFAVSAGSRTTVGVLTLEVGGTSETVDVKAETPFIQATSGERSFTVTTEAVQSLPMANRSYVGLMQLAPGVNGEVRDGGGGGNNIMMDGVSAMDTGGNSGILNMNVESIAEVRVITSNYQAEYGRASGMQVSATTKSGANQFHGSFYDVERNSSWYANSQVNIANRDPKTPVRERDWGYSVGGPVGKPGASNKLFFFYAHEFEPRTGGNNVVRYRVPTDLERQGNFSQTTDNNGAPYPYIKDPLVSGTCSSASQAACFADGGLVGKIPANRLYSTGLNILNLWPLPNIANVPAGQNYNFELTRPSESVLSYQPAVRFDYQATRSLRVSGKWSGWRQRDQVINGTLPGFNDTQMPRPLVYSWGSTVDYSISPTAFLEGTFGSSQNEQAGCSIAQTRSNPGPNFCQLALPMNPVSDMKKAGLGDLPMLYPDANIIDPSYYAYQALNKVNPPFWDGNKALLTPSFTWGNRIASPPPSIAFPGFLNKGTTYDVALSFTKLVGRHTLKAGFYNSHSLKRQQRGGSFPALTFSNDTSNPLDSTFGYANAALGIIDLYTQGSKYVEGAFVYNQPEAYVQDNWKVNQKLTLDYGLRLVHEQPQRDSLLQGSNFLPEEWSSSAAPVLYVAGCANGVYPCSGTNRQAMNPATGQFLGPNSILAIGTLVPNTGSLTNGLFLPGQGIATTYYTMPNLGVAPRFGMAYDLTGRQRLVLRGGGGLFFERASGNTVYSTVSNPPAVSTVTVRYGDLRTLSTGGLATVGAPALNTFEYESKLPGSAQWNAGVQMELPWMVAMDVSYVGQHSFNMPVGVNINAVDFGTAFQPGYQDATLAASATPGATAVSTDLMRAIAGYGTITQQQAINWNTYHSIQISFLRRFSHGVSFGFNDTEGLSTKAFTPLRFQHGADGSYTYARIKRKPMRSSPTLRPSDTRCAGISSGTCLISRAPSRA